MKIDSSRASCLWRRQAGLALGDLLTLLKLDCKVLPSLCFLGDLPEPPGPGTHISLLQEEIKYWMKLFTPGVRSAPPRRIYVFQDSQSGWC